MIQLFLNKAGSGKTKRMIEMANKDVLAAKGQIVYVESTNKHMFDLNRDIRLISTKDFNLNTSNSFYGFLCGIISENYDIEKIYINGLGKIVSNITEDINEFFSELDKISTKYQLNIVISLSLDDENLMSKLSKYSLIEDSLALA